jgi:hypothetical protein
MKIIIILLALLVTGHQAQQFLNNARSRTPTAKKSKRHERAFFKDFAKQLKSQVTDLTTLHNLAMALTRYTNVE